MAFGLEYSFAIAKNVSGCRNFYDFSSFAVFKHFYAYLHDVRSFLQLSELIEHFRGMCGWSNTWLMQEQFYEFPGGNLVDG